MNHMNRRHPALRSARRRRGSTLVLVAGILVLLVIIASSYLSRTRAERTVSVAVRNSSQVEDRSATVKNDIAGVISESLFPKPIDPASLGWFPAVPTENPNSQRLPIDPGARRYTADRDFDGDGVADLPYNRAPYIVRPWTNWPDVFIDPVTGAAPRSDDLLGNPGTNDYRWLASTEPGRWIYNNSSFGMDSDITTPDIVEVFTHWHHMTNLMSPGNGYVVLPFINDMESSIAFMNGLPLGPYGTPFEQWLPQTTTGQREGWNIPANYDPNTGKCYFPGRAAFDQQWNAWFTDYEASYHRSDTEQNVIPANYYRLADCGFDLDGNGTNEPLEIGERPQDAFVGPGDRTDDGTVWPEGTPRWNIERVLADADGDGWTDSFWHLAPTSIDDETRTLVAVRIADLSGMANVNTATQFVRGLPAENPDEVVDYLGRIQPHGTRGWTPSDVALYERSDEGTFGVGLLGIPEHWEEWFPDGGLAATDPGSPWGVVGAVFNSNQWDVNTYSFLPEIGSFNSGNPLTNDVFAGPLARLDHWRRSGSQPGNPAPPESSGFAPFQTAVYTPFELDSELELRAYHSSNMPWVQSRLERALQSNDPGLNGALLRAQIVRPNQNDINIREETVEYLDQLDVRGVNGLPFHEPLHDIRRHLTTYNGARNETLPPWLWWENRFDPSTGAWSWPSTVNGNGNPNDPTTPWGRFVERSRFKLDLREIRRPLADPATGDRTFSQRLVPTLQLALTDGETTVGGGNQINRFYYDGFASAQGNLIQTRRLAAAFAANILAWRDLDDTNLDGVDQTPGIDVFPAPVFPNPADPTNPDSVGAIPVPTAAGEENFDLTRRFLGMEPQPFITEAFIAHVYESAGTVPVGNMPPFHREGENYVDESSDQTTIVAVQIMNPFDRPIDLRNYRLRVYGQVVELQGVLFPANEGQPPVIDPIGRPRSCIVYSIEDGFAGDGDFKTSWLDFLDIQDDDLYGTVGDGTGFVPVDTIRIDIDLNAQFPFTPLSKDRDDYDREDVEPIELVRVTPDAAWTDTIEVVVDRVDNPSDQTDNDHRFRDAVNDISSDSQYVPPASFNDPNVGRWDGVRIDDENYFMAWARVARLWRQDFNNDNFLQDNERGPRFVFTSHPEGFDEQSDPDLGSTSFEGRSGSVTYEGDSFSTDSDPDATVWSERSYVDPNGTARTRKPTFFPSYTVWDAGGNAIYRPPVANEVVIVADKGMKDDDDYFYPHPIQMLHKNGDFEHVGELLNVFLYGHFLDIRPNNPTDPTDDEYLGTLKTFSEYMSDQNLAGPIDTSGPFGDGIRVNRLATTPNEFNDGEGDFIISQVLGVADLSQVIDTRHAMPRLPAGVRVLDAFVCDGPGFNAGFMDVNQDGTPGDVEDFRLLQFGNAQGFEGEMTPGLINPNTAPVEAIRALPNGYRFVHTTNEMDDGTFLAHLNPNDPTNYQYSAGRTRLAEAIEAYRLRLGDVALPEGGNPMSTRQVPKYGSRGLPSANDADALKEVRGDYGFASIGELMLLDRPGRIPTTTGPQADIVQWNESWQVSFGGMNPLRDLNFPDVGVDVDVSVDVQNPTDFANGGVLVRDETAADLEEHNLIFNGVSNLVSPRSDTFVAYFKVRHVRKDPATGLWDGTDPESVVDEARYVMIVDRSNVDRPTDEPRIVLFEKLPN